MGSPHEPVVGSIELLGRAGLRYRRGGRSMEIDSEILEGPQHFFVVYQASIARWNPPDDREPVDERERAEIVADTRRIVRASSGEEIEVV